MTTPLEIAVVARIHRKQLQWIQREIEALANLSKDAGIIGALAVAESQLEFAVSQLQQVEGRQARLSAENATDIHERVK